MEAEQDQQVFPVPFKNGMSKKRKDKYSNKYRGVKILKSPFWSELPKHERRHSCQTSGLHRTLEEM